MKIVKGDLLDTKADIIIHGCNCFCTMNSGVAKDLRSKWPGIYIEDLKTARGDRGKLGTYTSYTTNEGPIIVNAYTQHRYGTDKQYLEYSALRRVFSKIHLDFEDSLTIALPKIGCGLAGGDWKIVQDIIQETLTGRDITIYYI